MARLIPLGLAALAAFELRDFLREGLPLFWDAHSHLARAGFAARAFEAGELPLWCNDWYGGYRLLEFYSPAYYWLTGGLALAVGNVVVATKIVLWVGQVLAVVAFYAFVRRLSGNAWLGVFAGVLLLHCAERAWVLGVIGNHPSVLLYAAMPLLLAWVVRCCDGERWQPWRLFAGQSLLLGVMALSHLAHTAAILPAFLAFEGAWLWQARPSAVDGRRALAAAAASFAALGALTAFSVVPAALDLHLVSLQLDSGLPGRPPLRSLLTLAGLAPYSRNYVFLRDHGGLWFALGIAGALGALLPQGRRWRPVALGLGVALVCTAGVGERAAIGVGFFLYALCAAALDILARVAEAGGLPGTRRWTPALAIAGVLVAEALASRPAQVRYQPPDALEVYALLRDPSTHGRSFDVTPTEIGLDGFYGVSSVSPLISGRGIPFGGYPQGAPIANQVGLALLGRLAHDLDRPRPVLSEQALDALYLAHVRFLVEREPGDALRRRAAREAFGEPVATGVLALRHASPAIFAPRLAGLPEPFRSAGPSPELVATLEKRWNQDPLGRLPTRSLDALVRAGRKRDWELFAPIVRAMGIDRATGRAQQIWVGRPLPEETGADAPDGPVTFEVLEHDEGPNSVRLTLEASAPGFVRLSYSYDPDLGVLLDDQPVQAIPDALGGAVVIPLPAGTHRVELRTPEAGLRAALAGLAGLVASGLLWVAIGPRLGRST